MKFNLVFYFIQTNEQAKEGLWIMFFLVTVLIVLAIWAQLQPDEEENASYTPAGFDKSPYEKKTFKIVFRHPWLIKSLRNTMIKNQMMCLLKRFQK